MISFYLTKSFGVNRYPTLDFRGEREGQGELTAACRK